MDLKTFVSETLSQIVEGVNDAQRRIEEGGSGAAINPESVAHEHQETHGVARPVEFDVAVFAGEQSAEDKGEKIGASVGLISVLTARAAAEVDNRNTGSSRNETTSRIRFTVMLAQPAALSRRPPVQIPRPRPSSRI
jgi:hypothetical protein